MRSPCSSQLNLQDLSPKERLNLPSQKTIAVSNCQKLIALSKIALPTSQKRDRTNLLPKRSHYKTDRTQPNLQDPAIALNLQAIALTSSQNDRLSSQKLIDFLPKIDRPPSR